MALGAALLTMGGLGAFFAAALAVADKKLRVYEDPRIGQVNDVLPGANCGACGFAGCAAYAEAVVEGKAEVNACPVGGADCAADVAAIMGVEAGGSVRQVARILCKGGHGIAAEKADYEGPTTCAAQTMVSGGGKACVWGCLGGGDCVTACTFDAIEMGEDGLPKVFDALCTGCGACVKACPRDIIELHPEDRNMFVFCRSHDDAKTAKAVCKVACIGCSLCARKSNGAITMDNNLAVIDHEKLDTSIIPLDKCRTGAITWLVPPAVEEVPEQAVAEEPAS